MNIKVEKVLKQLRELQDYLEFTEYPAGYLDSFDMNFLSFVLNVLLEALHWIVLEALTEVRNEDR